MAEVVSGLVVRTRNHPARFLSRRDKAVRILGSRNGSIPQLFAQTLAELRRAFRAKVQRIGEQRTIADPVAGVDVFHSHRLDDTPDVFPIPLPRARVVERPSMHRTHRAFAKFSALDHSSNEKSSARPNWLTRSTGMPCRPTSRRSLSTLAQNALRSTIIGKWRIISNSMRSCSDK
jgi:hypothetical protein